MIIENITETEPGTTVSFTTFMDNNNLTLQVLTLLDGQYCCMIKDVHIVLTDASVATMAESNTKGGALHKLVKQIYNKNLSGAGLFNVPVLANVIVENPAHYEETIFTV